MLETGRRTPSDMAPSTSAKSGDFISPFDSCSADQPSYSSEDDDSEDALGVEGSSVEGWPAEDLATMDSLVGLTCFSNNYVGIFEGFAPNHPQTVVGGLDCISAVSLTREDLHASSVDDMVGELERLNVEHRTSYPFCGRKESLNATSREQCSDVGKFDRCHPFGDTSWISKLKLTYQHIGRGSYGKVFKAMIDDRAYALKVVEASGGSQLRKVAIEARASLLLKHDNVVNSFKCCVISKGMPGCGNENQLLELWILQELCEGGTLQEAIRKPWLYPPGNDAASRERILVNLSAQVARGLEYIHAHGHIHGDLSSNNVLLALQKENDVVHAETPDNLEELDTLLATTVNEATSSMPSGFPYTLEDVILKISDFGRSKEKGFKSCRTDSIGTVTFMPPETLISGALNPSSDVYSYGILLVQLWTGKLPYEGCNFAQIIFKASKGETPPLPDDMNAPRLVKDLIRQCLSPQPENRPTATDALRILDRVASCNLQEPRQGFQTKLKANERPSATCRAPCPASQRQDYRVTSRRP